MLKRRLLQWEQDAIVAGYESGENEAALASEFGVSGDYPHILARRRGVQPKLVGRPRKTVQCVRDRLDKLD